MGLLDKLLGRGKKAAGRHRRRQLAPPRGHAPGGGGRGRGPRRLARGDGAGGTHGRGAARGGTRGGVTNRLPSDERRNVRRPMSAAFLIVGLLAGGGAVWLWSRAQVAAERRAADEKITLVKEAQAGWEERVKAVTGEALSKSQTSLLELAEAKLAPIKETLTKFETQSKELEDKRAREVTAIGERLREVDRGAGETAIGDRQPRHRAARAARPRPVGRGAAQARRRACGDARVLRLPHAGERARRRRASASARHGREAPGRQVHRRRLEGADRGRISTRSTATTSS